MAAPPGAEGRTVVIDAGAAIKLQRLERLGSELFTTSGVLAEVRDEKARALLQTLPVELKVREPLPADVAFVRQFAKATGDFGFLSQNDMDLIALTVQLHRAAGGEVREKPAPLVQGDGGCMSFDWAPARADKAPAQPAQAPNPEAAASGGADPDAGEAGDGQTADDGWQVAGGAKAFNPRRRVPARAAQPDVDSAATAPAAGASDETAAVADADPAEDRGDVARAAAREDADRQEVSGEDSGVALAVADEGDDDEDDELSDGSSAGEWVTPDNMHRFGVGVQPDAEVRVSCATADYSVQNVLLQMGITPLTFDGYAVRSVKMWGLICRACFLFTRESHKVFCPKCGHDTLVRVPIVVDQDGKATALNQGRKLRTKGTVFSIPKPQQGRGWKPVFAEDELRIGGRDREHRRLENLHSKERMARDPFNEDNGARAWDQRGTTKTGKMITGSAPRVQAGYGRVNPNANNFGGFRGHKKR